MENADLGSQTSYTCRYHGYPAGHTHYNEHVHGHNHHGGHTHGGHHGGHAPEQPHLQAGDMVVLSSHVVSHVVGHVNVGHQGHGHGGHGHYGRKRRDEDIDVQYDEATVRSEDEAEDRWGKEHGYQKVFLNIKSNCKIFI